MFAAHDQENLVHGHQAAAASKPLNQGTRQLAPKTPSKKVPKTPFKLPLNDENGGAGGKTGLKTKGGESKNAFATPGPINRAPLGAKTTNAKAKAFQTPVPTIKGDLGKTKKASVSAKKAKPKPVPAETTKVEKVDILGDNEEDEVPEIEYMPPRVKDLPDLPDDHFERDLSMFKKGNLLEGALSYFATRKGPDGLSHLDRIEKREKEKWEIDERRMLAREQRNMDMLTLPCMHSPECPTELCKDTIAIHKEAQEEYEKTMAIIDAEAAPKKPAQVQRPLKPSSPSTLKSKAAAPALSQPKISAKPVRDPIKKSIAAPKPRFGLSVNAKKPPPSLNPPAINTTRHAAAVMNSKSTIGHTKGRVVSSSLPHAARPTSASAPTPTLRPTQNKQNGLPKTQDQKSSGFVPFEERDTALSASQYWNRYGEPPQGSQMWMECFKEKLFPEQAEEKRVEMEEEERRRESVEEVVERGIREDALEDFELCLDLGGD
ncbi:uncharacterized protein KY384_008907 [Bacidia gigantensis]|uniref:uncharacterized protein n=1 Tax=Bacidia gigantensis TaxID=2732470 RepID=UPI001D04FEFF|nr:uncharacterized protein KY384_008907 [Bacidia gigantensis]KAG8525263.1 hypothetical protein KY384_008907 [Bacidia gigantensis]